MTGKTQKSVFIKFSLPAGKGRSVRAICVYKFFFTHSSNPPVTISSCAASPKDCNRLFSDS